MDLLLREIEAGFPSAEHAVAIGLRLLLAMGVGAIAGIDRERVGKSAGLRTHMLVALGAAVFVLVTQEAGLSSEIGRVIQGVAAGIGFIGGGTILKLSQEREIHGLTTAAGLWMTAAAGVAAGLGQFGLALIAMAFTWITLAWMGRLERRIGR